LKVGAQQRLPVVRVDVLELLLNRGIRSGVDALKALLRGISGVRWWDHGIAVRGAEVFAQLLSLLRD
jgi:hypothetical protein